MAAAQALDEIDRVISLFYQLFKVEIGNLRLAKAEVFVMPVLLVDVGCKPFLASNLVLDLLIARMHVQHLLQGLQFSALLGSLLVHLEINRE